MTGPSQPYIEIVINNHRMFALTDTGATCSAISEKIIKQMDMEKHCINDKSNIFGIAQSKITSLGTITLSVGHVGQRKKSYMVDFQVIRGLLQDVILGNNHLKKERFTICYSRNVLYRQRVRNSTILLHWLPTPVIPQMNEIERGEQPPKTHIIPTISHALTHSRKQGVRNLSYVNTKNHGTRKKNYNAKPRSLMSINIPNN